MQKGSKDINELMTVVLGEARTTVQELNEQGSGEMSLPKVESGFGSMVYPKRLGLHS